MDNVTKEQMEHNDAVEPNDRKRKTVQSPSYRRNIGPMKCLLCACPRKKWHKCPPSNDGFRPRNHDTEHPPRPYRTGFRGSTDTTGMTPRIPTIKRTYHKHHKNYNKNYFRRNNKNSTNQLSDEIRSNYHQDFFNEYYYYRFVRCCSDYSDIPFDDKLVNKGHVDRTRCVNKKGNGLHSNAKTRCQDEKSRRVDTEINNNDARNKRMDNNNNRGDILKKRVNDNGQHKSADKRISPETEMKKKEAAKDSYTNGKYNLALAQYTELIKLFPKSEIYYGNRSACHMMMGNHEKALVDARNSIQINPQFIKGHYRVIKLTLMTGKMSEMDTCLLELEKINALDEVLISTRKTLEDLNQYLKLENGARERKDNTEALRYINQCIEICSSCVAYKLRKARYLAHGERYEEADAIANDILENDKRNSWAKYILSIHMYHTSLEKAIPYLENIIRYAPKLQQARTLYQKAKQLTEMKEKGNEAFRKGEYCKAHAFYMRAMKIDPRNKKMKMQLYNNMAQASYKLGMRVKSIRECTKALEIDDKYLKALARRGNCHMELGNFSAAIDDFQRCCNIDQGVQYKNLLNEAKRKQEEEEREERERKQREEEERRRREEQRRRWDEEKQERGKNGSWWERFNQKWKEQQENFRSGSGYDYFRDEEQQRNQREERKEQSSGRQAKSGDYYAVLGLSKHACLAEIKAAYWKLAKIHHPDRHANSSEEVKKENEAKMKLITQAHRELTEAKETGFQFC